MIRKPSILALLFLAACGGGSTESGILIEGTLIQGSATSHARTLDSRLAHSAGQPIENVDVCALGECSRTDGNGVWGFVAPESFSGGMIEVTLNGHGILDNTEVMIPAGAAEVMVELVNVGGDVNPEAVWADGNRVHPDADGHSHSHGSHD